MDPHLKGHCHGQFLQSAKIFYKEPGLNINLLLLQLQEENIKVFSYIARKHEL